MTKFYSIDKKYFEYILSKGINAELVFKNANIPIKALDNKNLSISREQYIKLMDSLEAAISTHDLMCYSSIEKMIGFIPPLFAAMCSRDGITCFNTIAKYKKLIGPFVLEVNIDTKNLTLEFKFDDGNNKLPKFSILSEQVLVLSIIRKATGQRIIPTKITSLYEYDGSDFEEYFGIKPYKDLKSVIEFKIEDVKKPFLTENNVMFSYLEPELQKRIKEMEIDTSFAANVRSTLFELIPSGDGSIEMVAKELDVSTRTLQRKLAGEKTTFIKQLNHTRELLARSYLKDGTISNDDIAFLIGYSDANSFIRAFKSWTGMTITEYKEKYIS
ncbi:helix-turn-helix transcriptional regulator [uncultured Clostridium sp.]|jgi:AraC-like DNA-binding protein|uniref:helix-turn-helix domain-containing protein n=1 Tax=uncultured Clostridium sp. TaxID=59620 RepID=UPI002634278B|nr:helix-turn-helix transcriptional regulator [uncultured Clostridium sp.]